MDMHKMLKSAALLALITQAAVSAIAHPGLYGDAPDAKHAWAVHDWNRPKPHRVSVSEKGVPSDAIVLFDGSEKSFRENWTVKKGCKSWSVDPDGSLAVRRVKKDGAPLATKRPFGDCQLHLEFRHPASLASNKGYAQDRGNSGVFLMGTAEGYEVQVLESYNSCRETEGTKDYLDVYTDGQCGAVYAENPPMVNPQKKPGEWQVYDIVFHQPVWEDGRLVHPGSMTVFMNGVLVQDHWELEGQTTHRKRRPLKPHAKAAPLALQYHGSDVFFRNIWIRPLPSRWDNKTHSSMSADEKAVMKLRRETAAKLYAKIADPGAATAANVKALAEVVAYANEGRYKADFEKALRNFYAAKPSDADRKSVRETLDILVRNKVIGAELVK